LDDDDNDDELSNTRKPYVAPVTEQNGSALTEAVNAATHHDIIKKLWKTAETPEEKTSLFVFQLIFQLLIQVSTDQIEAWMKDDGHGVSVQPDTVLVLVFVRLALANDYASIFTPCYFRILLIKAGLTAKFLTDSYLDK
jgi:hypothetical protein